MKWNTGKNWINVIITSLIGIVLILALLLLLHLVFPPRTPPSIGSVEKSFDKYQEDIEHVVNFLIEEKYESILIRDSSGMMQADLQWMEIHEDNILDALNRLFALRDNMQIYKDGNTIKLLWWTHPQNISSSIAYSVNKTDLPDVQYATEILPMSDDGWYYVIADYNAWRVERYETSEE